VDGVTDRDGDGRGEPLRLTLGTGDVVALVDGSGIGDVELDGSMDSDGDGVGDTGDTVRKRYGGLTRLSPENMFSWSATPLAFAAAASTSRNWFSMLGCRPRMPSGVSMQISLLRLKAQVAQLGTVAGASMSVMSSRVAAPNGCA
jgi:hypothetical protein